MSNFNFSREGTKSRRKRGGLPGINPPASMTKWRCFVIDALDLTTNSCGFVDNALASMTNLCGFVDDALASMTNLYGFVDDALASMTNQCRFLNDPVRLNTKPCHLSLCDFVTSWPGLKLLNRYGR